MRWRYGSTGMRSRTAQVWGQPHLGFRKTLCRVCSVPSFPWHGISSSAAKVNLNCNGRGYDGRKIVPQRHCMVRKSPEPGLCCFQKPGASSTSQGGASEERLGPRAGYVEGLSHWLSMRNRDDPPTGLWSMPMLWDKVAVGTLNCRGVAQISEARFLDIWKGKSAALAAGQIASTGVSTWTPSAEPRRKRSTTFRTWSYSTASRSYSGSYHRALRK